MAGTAITRVVPVKQQMQLRGRGVRSVGVVAKRANTKARASADDAPAPNPKSGFEYAQTLPGISPPLGFWDPAGFCENTSPAEVKRYREAELTHGRVAMLASLGYIIGELPSVEQNPLFNAAVSGPALRQFQQVEAEGGFFWEILVLVIAIAEGYRISYGWKNPREGGAQLEDDYVPGDLGFDPLGLAPMDDPEALKELKTKELNNGRLAMFVIAGFVAQEEVDGMKILDHLGISN